MSSMLPAGAAEAVREVLFGPGEPDSETLAAAINAAPGEEPDAGAGVVVNTVEETGLLGPMSTKLEVTVKLLMEHIPTSVCHLFDPDTHPLLSCVARKADAADDKIRRLRITTTVDGYSAPAIDTVELDDKAPHEFKLLPTFFPQRLNEVTELTRATLSVLVEDLDSQLVELHRTSPVWLLARTTALLSVRNPTTGDSVDLTPYFGAFVTPNDPVVLGFLERVKAFHPTQTLSGYQGDSEGVTLQVQAAYDAVKADVDLKYVNTTIAFSPDDTTSVQRVRLPREALETGAANCIDGVVLLASLLEAMSLRPAIVVVPGHAFLGWETWKDSGEWKYLETTMLGTQPFDVAVARGEKEAAELQQLAKDKKDDRIFRRWPLRQLRQEFGIVPMR